MKILSEYLEKEHAGDEVPWQIVIHRVSRSLAIGLFGYALGRTSLYLHGL